MMIECVCVFPPLNVYTVPFIMPSPGAYGWMLSWKWLLHLLDYWGRGQRCRGGGQEVHNLCWRRDSSKVNSELQINFLLLLLLSTL